jgi:multimeric flavodoxin WrbA
VERRITVKILALIGSPRKGGNTDILVDQILKGSRAKGHIGEKLYLYGYPISLCTDCRKCKKGDLVCPIKDGMQKIYPKMTKADLIIFGTPNYWYGPTGKMKLLFDRMRPFAANGKVKGKRGIVVSPAGGGPKCCGPLVEMFRMSFDYLGMKFAGKILVTAYEKGEIAKNKKALKKAYDLGVSL